MVSPVYSVILIIVGVLMLLGVAVLSAVCGFLAWQAWALLRVNRMVGEKLAAAVESLAQFPAKLDALGVVVTDLKGFQEGDLRLIEKLIKVVTGLDHTVEEFEACLIPPNPETRRARPPRTNEVTMASEGDEIVREQQRKERGGEPLDMSQFGKNVASV